MLSQRLRVKQGKTMASYRRAGGVGKKSDNPEIAIYRRQEARRKRGGKREITKGGRETGAMHEEDRNSKRISLQ